MPNCLSFLLMDIGNSLTVREDDPCCEFVCAYGRTQTRCELLLFSSYLSSLMVYQQKLSD